MNSILIFLLLLAQNQPATIPNAAIAGVVRDKTTDRPLANYTVSTQVNATWVGDAIIMSSSTREVKSTTDESGRYRLGDLPPGTYHVVARDAHRFGPGLTKHIAVAGHDLEHIDFNVAVAGKIRGKVVDENKEPIPGITVFLVLREYYLGSTGYFLKEASPKTNDRGEYELGRVEAGQPYFLLAEKRDQRLPAHSETPLNPKLRRRVPMRTWYLNSPSKDGAAALILQPGETREGVNIEMKKSPSYCVEGTLTTPGGPAALNFFMEAAAPSSGISNGGGLMMADPGGVTEPGGAFRICDLYPGAYRIMGDNMSGNRNGQSPGFGVATINISDEDLGNVKIAVLPPGPLEGEVVLEGAQPETPISTKVSVALMPLLRANMPGENAGVRAAIPGAFTVPGVFVDDYLVRTLVNGPGLYIKDVTFAGRSIRYEPLRLGTAMGNAGLRVTVARDGATLHATVSTKDGNPVPDTGVLIMPVGIGSEGMLAAALVSGQTDQTGSYTSVTLEPGKYYVVATDERFAFTPEDIGRLWRAHNRFQEVELPPNGKIELALEPLSVGR